MSFYNGCFTLSKKTLSIIKETQNEAVIQLKRNQKTLFCMAKIISEKNKPLTTFIQPDDKAHGRITSRKTKVFEIPELSKSLDKEWDNIACIVKVERTRKLMNTQKKCYDKPKTKVHYYIVTKIFDAKTVLNIIQGHWGIENKVNYVKDVQFNEDLSRIRVNPGIFSRLRDLAMNVMRINNVTNISQERFINCCNINNALNYKGFI